MVESTVEEASNDSDSVVSLAADRLELVLFVQWKS